MESKSESIRDIGLEKQLFIDDRIVDDMVDVSRVLNPAQKHSDNPLLGDERQWENATTMSVLTAFYDASPDDGGESCFRMWYTAPGGVCYATSPDGLRWERPNLGLVDFQGSKENNLVQGIVGPTNGIVYSPEMVGSEYPERYYKTLCREEGGWAVYYSGDGLRWTRREENPVLTAPLLGDVCTTGKSSERFPKGMFYKQTPPPKYLAFPQLRVRVGRFERRCVGFSGCPMTFPETFTKWEDASLVLAPDLLDDEWADERLTTASDALRFDSPQEHRTEFLGLAGFRYAGLLLGFLWVLNVSGDWKPSPDGDQVDQDGIAELQLVSSRDLIHWQRVGDREPLIPLGAPGTWDSAQIYTANYPCVVEDEIWIYYTGRRFGRAGPRSPNPPETEEAGGHPGSQTAGTGLAKLRLDGFVSLDAGKREGTVTTRPLRFEGTELVINAQAPGGSVVVEILAQDGGAIQGFGAVDCDAFSGDSLRHTVTWSKKPDLSALRGEPVRLRFHLNTAKLYSFVFTS